MFDNENLALSSQAHFAVGKDGARIRVLAFISDSSGSINID
jgi:hypothetical protein